MLQLEIKHADGQTQQMQVPDGAVIGKASQCEVRLQSWRIGKEHARLHQTSAGILIEDLGQFGGTTVNGQHIEGHHGPLTLKDTIQIGPYAITVSALDGKDMVQAASAQSRSNTAGERNRMATQALAQSRENAERVQQALEKQAQEAGNSDQEKPASNTGFALVIAPDPQRKQEQFEWRQRLHAQLIETMDLRRHDIHGMEDHVLREHTEKLVKQLIEKNEADIPKHLDRKALLQQVLHEAIGLGPLEELLADDSVSEIMVNRFDEIYIERGGRLNLHPIAFTSDKAVMGVIERIVAPLGRRIDESSPMVDARLKDGSRVNAIIPPLALKGPCITIRKFAKRKLDAQDLVKFDAISPDMAVFLELCVVARKNIIVSGGTGSGKTTLLNILSNFIPRGERVITVEDAAELKLNHEHLISLESRPANVEGKGAVPIRDLVRNTLRMRPDRIVVGECRGAEALDMLQAMNTGHEGSLTTLHANTPRDALARLETLILMAGMDLPLSAIRDQVSSAVDIIVQQTRFSCGSRKVTSITEITGMESGKFQLQEIFRFQTQGYGIDEKGLPRIQGHFTACDMVPTFLDELRATNVQVDMQMFESINSATRNGS
jgi:pilus assembly protein CpaF